MGDKRPKKRPCINFNSPSHANLRSYGVSFYQPGDNLLQHSARLSSDGRHIYSQATLAPPIQRRLYTTIDSTEDWSDLPEESSMQETTTDSSGGRYIYQVRKGRVTKGEATIYQQHVPSVPPAMNRLSQPSDVSTVTMVRSCVKNVALRNINLTHYIGFSIGLVNVSKKFPFDSSALLYSWATRTVQPAYHRSMDCRSLSLYMTTAFTGDEPILRF
ncbi:hypothetical protein K435DRAFT_855350 [Dendrothele bispora CBS 962.96]|uniref:Uncharacterized protein n=1 Tax=Dendrothele bispora (strain CBS 962.96) TaxID=1314807 RepID=A0A4S8MCS3_DENBC|nr:hypothetical protein K435DRAFT_855350 [Dendrothele bispora CBS 962.96]